MAPDATPRALALAQLHQRFQKDADAVDPAWRALFAELDDDGRAWLESLAAAGAPRHAQAAPAGDEGSLRDSIHAMALIRAYRIAGHRAANLDPLGLFDPGPLPDLDPATYGFGEADWDRPIFVDGQLGLESATLREILGVLKRDYCGTIGIEFGHIDRREERLWILERMESAAYRAARRPEGKRAILERLTAAETFERFLGRKYQGTKRFGLDGAEAVIPALEMIVTRAVELGIEDIVIGMPHRGRLNVLANLMGKPLAQIFSEFQGGSTLPDSIQGAGDVKYHLGTSTDRIVDGRDIHLSLTPNPSHLEAVDPVVAGRVRAKQDQMGDTDHSRCMGLLLHGDAAFAGQGLVPETLQFCELSGYRTGGVIHVIVNNQIGFTTNPIAGRSSPYCSDVAKMIGAPIVHVNGDDPEAVVRAARAAVSYRQEFKKDVVLDVYCYRRFGHNEGDEPSFTQPRMYARIAEHATTREIYVARLVAEGVVTQTEADEMVREHDARFEAAFEESESYRSTKADWLEGSWSGLEPVSGYDARRGHTAAEPEVLQEVGRALTREPENFHLNRKIQRQLRQKRKIFESGEGVDWATAEALAYGTLLVEGHPVRLSGEDCGRGTFSQRHAVWVDQDSEARHVPLNHIREAQERFEVLDSPLSEFGVLGFEYGYAMAAPRTLVLWEAQFGDFANGAQIIFDQFLSAGEEKWLRMSGLVLLLPHGFEGQGPEHSSARLERFLQLCAEDNLQVVNCTTPASFFHALRRQMHRAFRKPLVVMSPKSLLRHKGCVSTLADLGPGSGFHRVLYCDDLPSDPADATQVVLCSGKVYYELVEERAKRGASHVHFLRLEQLYPFPADALADTLAPYKHCRLVWCQEEPRNMGAWDYVNDLVAEVAEELGCEHPELRYAGRETSASPATGSIVDHRAEQARLLEEAFELDVVPLGRLAARKALAEERKRS